MGRPAQKGLTFYSTDTDRYQDRKIKKLKKEFGCTGMAIWDFILNEIYREEGSFIVCDENCVFDVAEYFNIKETVVEEVIRGCVRVGLFNKHLFDHRLILTSKTIQERYLKISKDAKRVRINIPQEYDIIGFHPKNPKFPPEETPFPPEETPISQEERRQRKEKKRKEKELLNSNSKKKDVAAIDFRNEIPKPEHDSWRESWYMKFRVKPKSLSQLIDLFNVHLGLKDQSERPRTMKDYKDHFYNWCNVQDRIGELDKFRKIPQKGEL